MSSFDSVWMWMAFDAELLDEVENFKGAFGVPAMDGIREIPECLICGWDDQAQTRHRGMELGTTACVIPLQDDRVVIGGLWNLHLKAAWESGDVPAQELTIEQVWALRVEDDGSEQSGIVQSVVNKVKNFVSNLTGGNS